MLKQEQQQWREAAEECHSDGGNFCDEHAQVLVVLDNLDALRKRIAYLARVYAVAPGEPRCCSDCAANDISAELLSALDA